MARRRPRPDVEAFDLDATVGADDDPSRILEAREAAQAAAAAPMPPQAHRYDRMAERARREPTIRVVVHRPQWRPRLERPREPWESCEVCRGLPLSLDAACLGCCRSGADHLLEPVRPEERPRRRRAVAGVLAGGVGKPACVPVASPA